MLMRRITNTCAVVGRRFASSSSGAAAAVDPEHKAWLETVTKLPVSIPNFEWTLEWMLPTPVPLHQFDQAPIVVEVIDRNPDADALVYKGPNVVAGYPNPNDPSKKVSMEEHEALVKALNTASKRPTHNGASY